MDSEKMHRQWTAGRLFIIRLEITNRVLPQSSLFTGDSVTLRCEVDQSWVGRVFLWSKDSNPESTKAATKTISSVKVSHGGEYSFVFVLYPMLCYYTEKPKLKLTIKPDQHVFRGETVTLRCDINGEGVTSWQYSWYKDGSVSVFSELQEHTFRSVTDIDAGKYSCYGTKNEGSQTSNIRDDVTLTVSDRAQTVLMVSPQMWLTEGDPVTLICEVCGSSAGWTFSWFTVMSSSDNSYHYKLFSDSSRGSGGNYTVSSAALKHTGVYVCTAEREGPPYYAMNNHYGSLRLMYYKNILPNRTQHFTSVSLSLSCEDQSNSDRWTVRRYTDSEQLEDCSSSDWGSQTGSTCTIRSTNTSDTGVYWCQSESGENSNPLNITVHCDVSFRISDLCSPHTQFSTGSLFISASDSRADLQVLQNER
ncbi:Fc receptor-like protein 5 [Labeo rohita]|uniref:Fc receptor-like protein 5 n=1 Tax=Labeo rohita TaxID=84645 RepID=A0ABQ8MT08_LABRO|nr:Fc receptor-like protein 5 [Labeo rohita]